MLCRDFRCVPIIPRSSSENQISLRLPLVAYAANTAKHPNFKKPFLLLMSKVRSFPPPPPPLRIRPAPPSLKCFFPFSVFQPHPLYPSTPSQLSSEVSARANQALIHLKLTGRADYGDGFLLQKSYQHHLYRNTCRNMKELPSSISRSIVCRVCQTNRGQIILYAPEPRSLSHAVRLKGTDFKQTHGGRVRSRVAGWGEVAGEGETSRSAHRRSLIPVTVTFLAESLIWRY